MGILKYIFICLLYFTSTVQAQLSPGELAEPHSAFEGLTNCTKCHELGEGPSVAKCLECHSALAKQISEKKGLHFQFTEVEKKICFNCHNDHAGVDFQLIHWEKPIDQFDHNKTGYTLVGKHAAIQCRDCHNPSMISKELLQIEPRIEITKTFLGLQQGCLNCHHDEHRAQLGSDCLKCHNQNKWIKAEFFDHNKSKFILTGKHETIDCLKCHKLITETKPLLPRDSTYNKFTGIEFNSCTSCHKDIHVGKFGNDCNRCHVTEGWKVIDKDKMDHNKTNFPLTGKHIAVKCDGCHKPNKKFQKNEYNECLDCHKDIHKGTFGIDCMRCHVTDGWKILNERNMDHSKTNFPLIGKHKLVKCDTCHKPNKQFDKSNYNECLDCHSDYHQKQFVNRPDKGKCESCHTVNGFKPTLFTISAHNETEFKLVGGHLAQPCFVCHKLTESATPIQNFKPTERLCQDCHRDPHFSQFAKTKSCLDCHNTIDWKESIFNHETGSTYHLKGAHKKVSCDGCHKQTKNGTENYTLYKPLESKCESCHASDIKPLE